MNKPVYLGLSTLELSKILMYEFWYDYVKSKYGEKAKWCYMDTDSLLVYKKLYITENVETRFDASNYELDDHCLKEKNKKVFGLLKDEMDGKIMIIFVGSRAKTYNYLIDDDSEDKIAKGTKMCVMKRKHKFENCKIFIEAIQLENKVNHLEQNKINIDHKENNKFILKTQQRFKVKGIMSLLKKLIRLV